jgi:large subunit ribosomal protein L22
MELKYSRKIEDESIVAKAMGADLNISFKSSVAICDKLKGMRLADGISLLEAVIALEKSIPFRRYSKGIGHRPNSEEFKVGKYPKKAAYEFLKILRNLEANAEFKGLNTENLKIIHVASQKGRSIKKTAPKGRWKRWLTQLVNIQVIAEEAS